MKMITEGAVKSYLRDIGVSDIIRLIKTSDSGVRVIIGDKSIENTVYGLKKFSESAVVMSYKSYRSTKHETEQNDRKNKKQSGRKF